MSTLRGGAARELDENEWVAPLIESTPKVSPHMDAITTHTVTDEHAGNQDIAPASEEDEEDRGPDLLTMLPACHLTDTARAQLNEMDVDEVYVELTTEDDVEHVVDEVNWIPFIDVMRFRLAQGMISGALLMHAGV